MSFLSSRAAVAAVLGLTAAVVAAACGGDPKTGWWSVPSERGPATTVEQFGRLMAQGRAWPACGLLTARAQGTLAAITGSADRREGCAMAVGLMTGARDDDALAALRHTRVRHVRVRARRAEVAMSDVVGDGGVRLFDESRGPGRVVLVPGTDRWLIDDFR